MMRLAILASHPVQYYAPLFREVAKRIDLTVFYAHDANTQDQALAGFGVGFAWDVDLLSGYHNCFLRNVSRVPGLDRFSGVDTPEISRALQDGRFDALLLMGWHLKCFIQGLISAKRIGLPVMLRGDSHLDTPRSMVKLVAKRALYPWFLRQFDAALVVGKRNRAYWQYYGYPPERMFNAPHCIDNFFFAERATPKARQALRMQLGIAPRSNVVMFAGKLLMWKRPLDLVEASALVRETGMDITILVAGAGPMEVAMRDRAGELDIPMHLLGFCNQTEMPAAYAAADVLVLPSSGHETWGLVVNEALASGVPVIVSDAVGCAPDLMEIIGSDAVFTLGNVSELAERICRVLTSPPPSHLIANATARSDPSIVADCILEAVLAMKSWRGS